MARRITQECLEVDIVERRPSRVTQVVLEVDRCDPPPHVYGCVIPNAYGRAGGVPEYGDRASWRTDYDDGATHADDWEQGDSHHEEVTLGENSAEELTLNGQELTLAEVLTPAEHTEIGDNPPHHAAVTLDEEADGLLSLTEQEIGLDEQAANTVFAGPASGVDAVPMFRALGAGDLPAHASIHEDGGDDEISVEGLSGKLADQQMPVDHDHSGDTGDGGTFDAANLTSGAAADGQVLTADGAGGAAWEDVTGGGSPLNVQEIDGTPSVDEVTTIKVTNGTLTDDGNGVVTLDFGSAATDGSAIHDNEAGEIHAIAEKNPLEADDEVLIEDSADSHNKKRATISAITFTALGDTPDSYSGKGGKAVYVKADESGLEFL